MSNFTKNEKISHEKLLKNLNSQISYDINLINKVYDFCKEKYKNKLRLSGDTILNHCLNTAYYVSQLNLDTTSICAALLHDILEVSNVEIDEIDRNFGTEIAFIVDGLTSIKVISKRYKSDKESKEDFKKLVLSSAEDLRIIMVRLCEKLDNSKTLDSLPKEIRELSARKMLNIYAPLAEYIGLGLVQRELEDSSFKILKPKESKKLEDLIDDYFKTSENVIQKFETEIIELLNKYLKDKYKIETRRKGLYSAYKKIKAKYLKNGKEFEDAIKNLMDIYAARIIVDDVEQCYIVFGLFQENYDLLAEEFKDYIARPKENGYKSIHALFEYMDTVFEVQIRTKEMHEYNEFGPACHIAYKLQRENRKNRMPESSAYTWTKDLVNWKGKQNVTKDDFKIGAFQESIFCFTPKGLVIDLKKGAGPLDFGFKVHTDLGLKYRGALVNGKMVSMDYKLKTGDVVEILTSKNINASADWIKLVKSPTGQAAIRKALRRKLKVRN